MYVIIESKKTIDVNISCWQFNDKNQFQYNCLNNKPIKYILKSLLKLIATWQTSLTECLFRVRMIKLAILLHIFYVYHFPAFIFSLEIVVMRERGKSNTVSPNLYIDIYINIEYISFSISDFYYLLDFNSLTMYKEKQYVKI